MTVDPGAWLQFGALGLLAALLAALAFGTIYSARWLAREILTPVKQGHLEYLRKTAESAEKTAAAVAAIPELQITLEEVHSHALSATQSLHSQTELLTEQSGLLRVLHQDLTKGS